MADDYKTEQKKAAEALKQQTAELKKTNLPKRQREHISELVGLTAVVIQAKKSLSDTIKQQNQINQKNSIINNILANSKGELIKSVIAARQANLRVTQKIQVTEQEINVAKQTIVALQQQVAALAENKNALTQSTNAKRSEQIAIEENLTEVRKNRQSILEEIKTRATVRNVLQGSVNNTSALRDATDARIAALKTDNSALEDELKTKGIANSRLDEIINTMKDNKKAMDAERLKRFDLTGVLTTQESEMNKLVDEIKTLQGNLSQTSEAASNFESRLESITEEMKELTEKTTALGQTEVELSDAMKKQTDAVKDGTDKMKLLGFEKLATKMGGIANVMDKVADPINKMVASVRELQNKFGVSAGTASKLGLENLKSSVKSFADALRTGGASGPGVTMEQIAQAQVDYQEQFGGLITSDAATDLAKEAVKMGVSSKQLAEARRVFLTQTMGDAGKAQKQTDKFVGEFAKKGLSAGIAMQEIAKNSELLARNGTRFAGQMARAMADAKKIGVDLSKVSQFGDSLINNFEGFLEGQAALGAMGFNLDSNRLAQISETGSDTDLYNELKSQLASTGKDITKLTRSQRLELESAFGMNISDMQKLAAEETPGAGGEKTIDPIDLQKTANESLANGVNFAEASGKTLNVISDTLRYANTILGVIATNTGLGALKGMFGKTPSAPGKTPSAPGGTPSAPGKTPSAPGGTPSAPGGTPSAPGGTPSAPGGTPSASPLSRGAKAMGGAKIGAGMGALSGLMSGISEYQEGGSIKKAFGRGLANMAGSIIGGALGSFIPIPGVGTMLGAAAGGWAADWLFDKVFADDMTSKPGYGKRSLVTPSGVISLNNKDNIIAYADDLDGAKKLPYGSIAKKAGEKYEQLDVFKKQVNDTFAQFISPSGGFGQISKFLNKDLGASATNKVMSGKVGGAITKAQELNAGGKEGLFAAVQNKFGGLFGGNAGKAVTKAQELNAGGKEGLFAMAQNKFGSMFGGNAGKAVTKAQELNAGGKEGLFAMAQNKFGSMFGGKTGGAMSSVSNLFTGGGSTSSNLMSMATKIPVLGGLLGKATGLLSSGGLKGMAGSLLGKVGLGSLGGSLLGGPMGLAGSLAAPLLKKIPFIGGAAAALAGGPGKLMSSALGKIGGLFGKKKAPAVSAMGAMMPEMGNMMSMLPFLSGAQPTTTQGTPQPQAPISVDTTGIEKQLNNFINALQGIQIHMDGAKVGKALVNSNDAASSIGVFREQSR